MSERPIKVAVVGGGCAAMATAFELTRPEHQGRYAVTVHQVGWRLGGKGASGRGVADRIEEHGLHLWMGFYENAFRLMRECYDELGRAPGTCPIVTWQDALVPAPVTGVIDRMPDGTWVPWTATLPPGDGLPGDAYREPPRWSVGDYLRRALALARTVLDTLQNGRPSAPVDGSSGDASAGASERDGVMERATRLLRFGELATLAALIEAVELLETMTGAVSRYPDNLVLRFLDAVATNARSQLEASAERDLELYRLWTILDLTLATIRGIVRFQLTTDPRGFEAIDEYDCREWLRLNGASQRSVDSGYLRALYDLGFSYEDGAVTRPRIAAGQALRSMVRAFFTYRGSFFWRMQGGMGDIVFAPFYEVLRRRGVRFEFFHRLEHVRLADTAPGEAPYVAALEVDVQADVVGGGEYRPLVDVHGLPSWPAAPDWSQLVDGERLAREGWELESWWDRRKVRSRTLRVGEDFDLVVLGVGLGTVPYVCADILARDPRWRAMVDHVKTVPTQAFQVWMDSSMEQLGWHGPPVTVSGFVEPFDTWADMRHLIAHERWPQPPRALAYFCSVLPDGMPPNRGEADYPARQHMQVRANAIQFLNRDVGHLWPRAVHADRFRWEMLTDARNGASPTAAGEARFDSQFWTANVNPSDRYVLSLPGSSGYRISPLDGTYDNLVVTGDWTACGFNAGCVEAAVMSGQLAAHAIAKLPRLEDIVGYDHP